MSDTTALNAALDIYLDKVVDLRKKIEQQTIEIEALRTMEQALCSLIAELVGSNIGVLDE